jgi:hypothetical protein
MTSTSSQQPASALRARLIEGMIVRGFTKKTRNDYIRNVRAFAAFICWRSQTSGLVLANSADSCSD